MIEAVKILPRKHNGSNGYRIQLIVIPGGQRTHLRANRCSGFLHGRAVWLGQAGYCVDIKRIRVTTGDGKPLHIFPFLKRPLYGLRLL